jgi:hypothetical protein
VQTIDSPRSWSCHHPLNIHVAAESGL